MIKKIPKSVYFIPLFVCFLHLNPGLAQNKIDSLEQLVAESNNDSLKMEWYNQLRRIASYTNPEKAKGYILNYIDLAHKLSFERKENIGKVYLGNTFYTLGEYNTSLKIFLEAEKYFSETKDTSILANVYNGMAAASENSGNDTITLKYFTRAYELFNVQKDARRSALALNNMGNIYVQRKDYPKAIEYMEEAFTLIEGSQFPEYKAVLGVNLANAFKESNDLNKADSIYQFVLSQLNEKDDTYNYLNATKGLGEIQLLKNNFNDAVTYLEKAKTLSQNNNFMVNRDEIYYSLYLAYNKTNNPREALEALRNYTSLRDSIFTVEKDKNLAEALQKFEAEKKDIELAQTQLKLERQSLQKRNFLIISIAAILLAAIAFWFLYFKSKTNRILKDQKNTIQSALKEKEMLLKEIHHRVKNNLQVIASLLNLQSRTIEDQQAKDAIKEGQNRVKSMALIHQNLYQTEHMNSMEVGDYIGKLGESLFNSYNVDENKVTFNIDTEPLHLDVDTLIPLGLILNELLSNALKHAFPEERKGEINVVFKKEQGDLLLSVQDNGVGYSSTNPNLKKKSFGMTLIDAFSEKLNAAVEVLEQGGTIINIYIKNYNLAGNE
jgi:two-component sensor histidine kinase